MTGSIRIENRDDLEEFVARNIGAIEPGLRALRRGVTMGTARVDILAVDRAASAVLVGLQFEADDALLLRMLDAYSWCRECPEALRALVDEALPAPVGPPRVIFIAERLNDAFIRRVRHLVFRRVDCLEFRVGIQFNSVEQVGGSCPGQSVENRGEPERIMVPDQLPQATEPPPIEAGVRLRRDDSCGPPAARLEGLQLPASGRVSPEWRSSVSRLPAEDGSLRVAALREYLQREFPAAIVYDFHDHQRDARVLELHDASGIRVHAVAVPQTVLEGSTAEDLAALAKQHHLARALREAGRLTVLMTLAGCRAERV